MTFEQKTKPCMYGDKCNKYSAYIYCVATVKDVPDEMREHCSRFSHTSAKNNSFRQNYMPDNTKQHNEQYLNCKFGNKCRHKISIDTGNGDKNDFDHMKKFNHVNAKRYDNRNNEQKQNKPVENMVRNKKSDNDSESDSDSCKENEK